MYYNYSFLFLMIYIRFVFSNSKFKTRHSSKNQNNIVNITKSKFLLFYSTYLITTSIFFKLYIGKKVRNYTYIYF
jgi:hypothetical protein